MTTDSNALAAGLLTVRDSQILQLLSGGTSERRVVDIGNWRRSWTTDDVQRVTRDYLAPPRKRAGKAPRPSRPRRLDPGACEQWLPPVFGGQPTVVVLTPARSVVLTALCEGLTNSLIAERLEVTEDTVKTHVAAILAAFRAKDRMRVVSLVFTGAAVVQVQSRSGRRSA